MSFELKISEGLAVEREPQGGRGGGKEGGQRAQEGAGLVQVVWRNASINNNHANEHVDEDRKRYEQKQNISKLHCLWSGAVR